VSHTPREPCRRSLPGLAWPACLAWLPASRSGLFLSFPLSLPLQSDMHVACIAYDIRVVWLHRYNSSPRRLCGRALHGVRKRVDDEVVVLSQVLAHAINNVYQGYHDLEVRSVNGTTVRNLRHMKALVEGTAEELTLSAGASAAAEGSEAAGASLSPWIEIVLEGSRLVVIPREGAMAATQEILDNFRVSNHCSQDLLPPPSR
jgi:hypothetical protein